MDLYLLIVDVTVCKVTPVILHAVVSPGCVPRQRERFREVGDVWVAGGGRWCIGVGGVNLRDFKLQGYLAHKRPAPPRTLCLGP